MEKNKQSGIVQRISSCLKSNSTLLIFILLALFTSAASGETISSLVRDISSRFFRNILLILALILPITAGIGLNFGVTLGAIGSELALVFILAAGGYSSPFSLLWWMILTIVICTILGYFLALLFNATKGQEMISGLFVGFFSSGVYMFILMVILGGMIKLDDPNLVSGVGQPIKSTINLPPSMFQGFDRLQKLPATFLLVGIGVGIFIYLTVVFIKAREKNYLQFISRVALIVIGCIILLVVPVSREGLQKISVPVVTGLLAVTVALITAFLSKTKLGHDFLAIKYDIEISSSVGINVYWTRMIAIVLSTVFAGLGQMIYIQNLGTMQTYAMHGTTATFAIATILIGGATIKHASIKHAVIGTILFNCIYSTAPNAAKNLFGNIQIGEYFRVFMCYGIIAVAIVVYAMKEVRLARERIQNSQ